MKRSLSALAAIAVAGLSMFVAPATAAQTAKIREIDSRIEDGYIPGKVVITVALDKALSGVSAVKLEENGKAVDIESAKAVTEFSDVGIVLALDMSDDTRSKGTITEIKKAASEFVVNRPKGARIALVSFGSRVNTQTTFTDDEQLLLSTINKLQPAGDRALWDAVDTGAALFEEQARIDDPLLPHIVVVNTGVDIGSQTTPSAAAHRAEGLGAQVYGIGLANVGTPAVLQAVIGENGEYVETTKPRSLGGIMSGVRQSINRQYRIVYESPAATAYEKALNGANADEVVPTAELVEVKLTVNGDTALAAEVQLNSLSRGEELKPAKIKTSRLPDFFASNGIVVVAVVAGAAAVALLAYGAIQLFDRRSTLDSLLRPYVDRATGGGQVEEDDPNSHIELAIMKKAVARTEEFAKHRGFLDKVTLRLEQADLPVKAGEVVFFGLIIALIAAVLGAILLGLIGAVVGLLVGAAIPSVVVNMAAKRRSRKFTSQLPDTLQLLASTLRSGYSLLQGVDAVAKQVEEPMAKEFKRAMTEARLGRPVEEALSDVADRTGSIDFAWAVMAVKIQREVGGNLSELLLTVAETMVARERLRREVRALTAEGRISAIILGILPLGLGVVLFAINPDYMRTLFETSTGKMLLSGSGVMAVVGFYWMKKTIEVDI